VTFRGMVRNARSGTNSSLTAMYGTTFDRRSRSYLSSVEGRTIPRIVSNHSSQNSPTVCLFGVRYSPRCIDVANSLHAACASQLVR
jgi:hypothetical protein